MRVAPQLIQPYVPAVSNALRTPGAAGNGPGLIVDASLVAAHNPELKRRMALSGLALGDATNHFVVVAPADVPLLFRFENELGLLKTVAKAVTHEASPLVGHAIDAAWLVYGALRLREALKAPNRNRAACFWQFAGLGLETAKAVGDCAPALKMPDPYANGVNYIVAAGSALAAGRAPPILEMMSSNDERNAIPLAAMKVFGMSLDGGVPGINPAYAPLKLVPWAGIGLTPSSTTPPR